VVRWYFFAVADVTTKTLVSRAFDAGSTVTPSEDKAFWSAAMAVEIWVAAARGVLGFPCR
jgi:hypothetical protein